MSCQKDAGSAPEIEFLSPVHAQKVDLGEVITVDIDIWDDQKVDSYEIILESEVGFEYFRDEKEVNSEYHKISYDFDFSSAQHQNIKILVSVIDNDGNRSKSMILVNANK